MTREEFEALLEEAYIAGYEDADQESITEADLIDRVLYRAHNLTTKDPDKRRAYAAKLKVDDRERRFVKALDKIADAKKKGVSALARTGMLVDANENVKSAERQKAMYDAKVAAKNANNKKKVSEKIKDMIARKVPSYA